MEIIITLIAIIASSWVGYLFGAAKTFRDQKLKAYEEILPVITKVAFEPTISDQPEFNKAIVRIWLLARKNVALKVDNLVGIIIKPERGDRKQAMQEVISEMRADIQFSCWQRLKPEKIPHLYTWFGRSSNDSNEPFRGKR